MANFKKYNGYWVKDASALAHASIDGKTLTTTDREGRTVDTLTLPGGDGLITSATHMSYWDKGLITAYNKCCREAFTNNNDPTSNGNCALGQVIGSEMIGYGEITWDSSNSCFSLEGIRAVTTHGWRTFTKDITQGGATTQASFRNNLCRQYRPSNYKAYLSVGMKDKSITIPAGASRTILKTKSSMMLREPAGYGNGYVTLAKAIPTTDNNYTGVGVQFYLAPRFIEAYNPTSSDITIKSFVVELDCVLYNEYAERFFFDEPNIPFIEGINCTSLTKDDGVSETTSVIVKHHDGNSGIYLYEFKLTLDASTGEWSWVESNRQALGDGPASDTNNNKIFTFTHLIQSSDYSNIQYYTSAVAYALGGSGSSIGVNAYFTDGIPIPSWGNTT